MNIYSRFLTILSGVSLSFSIQQFMSKEIEEGTFYFLLTIVLFIVGLKEVSPEDKEKK